MSTQPHTPPMAAGNQAEPEQLESDREQPVEVVFEQRRFTPRRKAQPPRPAPRSRHRLRRLTGIPTGAEAL